MNLPVFLCGSPDDQSARDGLLAGLPRERARVDGRLWRMPSRRLVLGPADGGQVEGDLVGPVPERVLPLLDLLEGVPEGACRRVEVRAVSGKRTVRAWAWVVPAPRQRGGVPLER